MALVTLTSDYGLCDPHAAVVKGALWQEWPELQLCDISHSVEPGNYYQAAYLLQHAFRSFPSGTVHLVSVAELASQRWLALRLDNHFFIGADNGLLSLVAQEVLPQEMVEINIGEAKSLFPSRDFLARAAVHLARGGKLSVLGRSTNDFLQLKTLRPRLSYNPPALYGSVVQVDHHGNLITNITRQLFDEVGQGQQFEVQLPRNKSLSRLAENYQSKGEGGMLALFNSLGLLEVAFKGAKGKDYNGANSLLGLKVSDAVTVLFK